MMRRLGLKDVTELHSWFIKQMDAFLMRHGRRLLGWDVGEERHEIGIAPARQRLSSRFRLSPEPPDVEHYWSSIGTAAPGTRFRFSQLGLIRCWKVTVPAARSMLRISIFP